MKKKIEPRLIDIAYLDRELVNLFASIRRGEIDESLQKHKSRFVQEQKEKKNPDAIRNTNSILSVAKKLEILCTYGDHVIVKMDKKK